MKYKLILNECTLRILMGMLRIVICWVFDACTQNAKSPALTNFQAFFVTVSNCLSNHFYLNNLVKMSRTHQSKHGNIIDVPEKMHNCSILYLESKMCLILRCWLVDVPYLSSSQISVSCRFSTSFSCFIKLDQEVNDSAICRPTMSHVQGMQQVI